MKRLTKFWYLRHLLIVSIIILLVTIYKYNKESIFTWSCHQENVEASCAVVGLINLEKGHLDTAREYLGRACKMKYQNACVKLKEVENSMPKANNISPAIPSAVP